jgi:hypothetical protein
MALLPVQSILQAGTTPAAQTPSASDTIAAGSFGVNGVAMRVITTGTLSNISVLDPTTTGLGNAGTLVPLAAPATGARMLLVPRAAINPATGVATITSSSQTGLTYELYTY